MRVNLATSGGRAAGPRVRGRACIGRLGLALALALVLTPPGRTQDDEEFRAKSFAIPATRSARDRAREAAEHVKAHRWSRAIDALQTLVEEHRGEVLEPTREDATGRRSRQPIHYGASERGRSELLALPAEARELYRDRFGPEARAALEVARAAQDRRALVEVARRWPLSKAAEDAWWTLGDLELELGDSEAARAAWSRAEEARALAGEELSEGARRRLAFFAEGGDEPRLALASPRRVRGPFVDAERADGAVPKSGAHSWRLRIDGLPEDKSVPFNAAKGESFSLFPVLAGDTLLVSTSMRLIAIDAWSGAVRWRSREAPGWDLVAQGLMNRTADGQRLARPEFFDAVDRESALVAPAAAGGIAVAALQIPVSQLGNTRFQQIKITTVIPDRRLFAFDVDTGEVLWSHLPPPMWDGESGTFPERMRIGGPPVIAGTRILVPAYRMQGRVDYHMACFDLFTGELLWSTALISGQLPLNMFGRHQQEFSAAPARVAGEKVLALTQLGAIAALDLFTGDILWETLYDQIPLPRTEHWRHTPRQLVWKNAPPAVTGGTVVATPLDSRDMIGVDLELGTLLWSLPQHRLRDADSEKLTLLGAEGDTVWLAGARVLACRAAGGLGGRRGPSDVVESALVAHPHADPDQLPRPTLGERHVVAPTFDRRIALDRYDVSREDPQSSADWSADEATGNALLLDGALFTLSSKYLTATFDWEVLEERHRAQIEANPSDAGLALRFASFLGHRGEVELGEGRLRDALGHFERARTMLEGLIDDAPDAERRTFGRELHRVLGLEAETWVQFADSARGLELLARARELAPDRQALRDTLIATVRLMELRRDSAGTLEALDELDERCASLSVPTDELFWPGLDEVERAALEEEPIPVGLWVLARRARVHADGRRAGPELAALHAILERYGDVDLRPVSGGFDADGDVGDELRPADRIAAILESGGAAAYAPFERAARELLDRAVREDDPELLERLVRLYPHSAAAAEASAARLEAALASGDAATVVELVQAGLPDEWNPALAARDEALLALRLATVFERAGNVALAHGLVRHLALAQPRLRSDLAGHAGRTLAEIARDLPTPGAAPLASETSAFDETARVGRRFDGSYITLGSVPATPRIDEDRRVLVCARKYRGDDIVAGFAAERPSETVWSYSIELPPGWQTPSVLLGGRAVVAGRGSLVGLDAATGDEAWSRMMPQEAIDAVTGASGVVVATLRGPDRRMRLAAFDAIGGEALWSRPIDRGQWPKPVCGDGSVVVLPSRPGDATASVIDLFTGTLVREIPLDFRVGDADQRGAWIEGRRLILPSFPKSSRGSSDCISAWDVFEGRKLWGRAPEEDLELDSIVRVEDEAYLVFTAGPRAPAKVTGSLQELDTTLGAVRTVQNVRLGVDDVPIGVLRHTVARLDGPYLFLRAPAPEGDETLIRAIHLPFGERWVHRLPLSPDEYTAPMPRPALAKNTVALAYTEGRQSSGRESRTRLVVLDRANGLHRETRALDEKLGSADDIELATIGDALWVSGRDEVLVLSDK